jgi:type I restriction-modification system DNA methylase subunit
MKPHYNKALFSNHYLDALLPREDEFKVPLSELGGSLEEIKRVWDKKYLSSLNEPQLRKHFLDKVFEILGWSIDVEPPTPSGEWSRHPDYALFHTPEDVKPSQKATKEDYFKNTLCLGEAKRWGRPLDKKVKVDPEDPQNPSLQISRYLWLTEVKWGILTDGRYWRLYERETSKRLDIFYEIDLEDLVENGSPEDFKYFYLFFRRHAFPDFLEKVYKESIDYAEAVGEELKENVYQALKTLAQGFLKTPENDLKESYLKDIHDNSLIFLYRLLFILYAEHRGLLPVGENQIYTESYSLDVFKKEIADKLDKHETIATSTHGYWNKLKELFEIINIGNPELGVPPYNGGLFDPDKHDFLERYRVGDLYTAKAVDLLSRSSDRAYIDYGSLEIRHLGSIYEGLLEYKLKIAIEDLVPVKEKGKEVFIPLEEAKKVKKKIKEEEIVREGEIYLVTDKGERKATGSYYTPNYIVNYIIDNTLGPLVERIYRESKLAQEIRDNIRHFNEIFKEIVKERGEEEKQNLLKLWNLTRNDQERRDFLLNLLDGAEPSHGYDPLERILQLKILDPAMGSGHFLVEATDFLARELLKVLSGEPLLKPSKEMVIREAKEPYGLKEPEEDDIRWARREVVERCIFGVDLNPLAVELAKLSLWLYTVAKNRPLNFLDHHFRCGNSLLGARIENLASSPSLKKKKAENAFKQLGLFENAFREKVAILLKSVELIEALPSDRVEQIRKKEKYYQDFRKVLSRFQDVADVWTSVYFGNEIDF